MPSFSDNSKTIPTSVMPTYNISSNINTTNFEKDDDLTKINKVSDSNDQRANP